MKNIRLKIRHLILISAFSALSAIALFGCGEEDAGEDTGSGEESSGYQSTGDEYEDYIHEALEAVKDSATVDTGNGETSEIPDTDGEKSEGRVIQIERQESDEEPESVFVSGTEAADTSDSSSSSSDSSSSDETPKTTPDTFEVGTGFVYIDGKYDTTYSKDLLKIIQDARTGLNYPTANENKSLDICANLRAKEITCYLSHYRLDGTPYYSLAPDYYKAEIITIDGATAQETFDAWLEDPISRGIIFSKDYQSIGVSNYVCNGLNCIVVSFGY